MNLIVKRCAKCGELRKFLKGSKRDHNEVCGQCWNWGQKV